MTVFDDGLFSVERTNYGPFFLLGPKGPKCKITELTIVQVEAFNALAWELLRDKLLLPRYHSGTHD